MEGRGSGETRGEGGEGVEGRGEEGRCDLGPSARGDCGAGDRLEREGRRIGRRGEEGGGHREVDRFRLSERSNDEGNEGSDNATRLQLAEPPRLGSPVRGCS